ncbi:MAG: class I SAM-dependent rRNA methyltransferase [Candidatus Diapherotrites archaeon]|nr:class I SAM-dependent rRNA methyltransferase [Candidatus Diapherotrites archaeon]
MATVEINDRGAKELKRGALHVYAQNIVEAGATAGDWVEIRHGGETLGYGFYNPRSAITVRLFTWNDESPEEVLAKRLEDTATWKGRIYGDTYRWIFAEGDLVPGLVIDRYRDVAVVKNQTLGLEKYLEFIAEEMQEYGVDHIYFKGKGAGRKREGLPQVERWLIGGKKAPTIIKEGNAKFYVDVVGGQKTGFYLDQRENRIELERLVESGMSVLDVFASTGGFGVHAAVRGAKTTFVELGKTASKMIRKNLRLNKKGGKIITGDAIDVMDKMVKRGEQYDVVILDPPALAKGKADINRAKKMYFRINELGAKLVNTGGILVSCSCSHPITPRDFLGIVRGAAEKAERRVQMLGALRGQAPDHTVYLPQPETQYLKCGFFRVE